MTTDDDKTWRFDKTINLPSLMSVAGVALSGLWLFSQLQFQVNQNSADIAAWKVTWVAFTQSREISVRSFEQRMATQEARNDEILRRLQEIRDEQQRVANALVKGTSK